MFVLNITVDFLGRQNPYAFLHIYLEYLLQVLYIELANQSTQFWPFSRLVASWFLGSS